MKNKSNKGEIYSSTHPKNIERRRNIIGNFLWLAYSSKNKMSLLISIRKRLKKRREMLINWNIAFKLSFGFVPFEKKQENFNCSFKDYLNVFNLDREETKRFDSSLWFVIYLIPALEKNGAELSLWIGGILWGAPPNRIGFAKLRPWILGVS